MIIFNMLKILKKLKKRFLNNKNLGGLYMMDAILEKQQKPHDEGRIYNPSQTKLTDKDFLLMEMFGVG